MTAEDVTLVCSKCTRFIVAEGPIKNALEIAEEHGWKPDGDKVVCPRCPSGRPRLSIEEKMVEAGKILTSDSFAEGLREIHERPSFYSDPAFVVNDPLEFGTKTLLDGRVVRTQCSLGHPFDGEHYQNCPICEGEGR